MNLELHKLVGAGLPNIYLDGGVLLEGAADDQTVSYSDLGGLYAAITRALALCTGPMQASELRFLRKRLNYSQSDVARLGGKTEQAVAKWEKGATPVPKAEASLLRVAVLSKFGTKADMAKAVGALLSDAQAIDCAVFVFSFDGSSWSQNEQLALDYANEQARHVAMAAIHAAVLTSTAIEYTWNLANSPVVMNGYRHDATATTA